MKRFVFGECVQGFSHIQNNVECQDSCKKLELEDGTIVMSVADGHGSKACPFSKTGSEIAVNVFCEAMVNLCRGYQTSSELLPTYLNREGNLKIAQTIDQEWKQSVLAAHAAMKREMPLAENGQEDHAAVYRMYGSTLLGLLIAPTFVFAFQIGDGDITYIDDSCAEPIVEGDKLLGVESHSLSSVGAWKKAVSVVRPRNWDDALPALFMLSTDGFSNSHISNSEFLKTCTDYLTILKEHSASVVEANLNSWLAETSQFGCGDDITVLIAYFEDEMEDTSQGADEEMFLGADQEEQLEEDNQTDMAEEAAPDGISETESQNESDTAEELPAEEQSDLEE